MGLRNNLFHHGCSGEIEGQLGEGSSCSLNPASDEAGEESLHSIVFLIPLVRLDIDAP